MVDLDERLLKRAFAEQLEHSVDENQFVARVSRAIKRRRVLSAGVHGAVLGTLLAMTLGAIAPLLLSGAVYVYAAPVVMQVVAAVLILSLRVIRVRN